MIASKFGIGQQVRHSLLGYLRWSWISTRNIRLINRQPMSWRLTTNFAPLLVSRGDGRR